MRFPIYAALGGLMLAPCTPAASGLAIDGT
jgi:hypothetical protein